ncbi:MAG: 2,3,4,5-tetrahydropyridine-2,6-dicarboxylate N-succinyltransferase, partial [Pseudomonadota bacterium]
MSNTRLEAIIETAWTDRDGITSATGGEVRTAIEDVLNALDDGALRVAERRENGDWHVNQWVKKAVLLSFRLKDMTSQSGGPQGGTWWDKVDSKWKDWDDTRWKTAGFRAVPNCVVRRTAYIAPDVVLMPAFVNLGAY